MNIWAYIILAALVARFCGFVLLVFVDGRHDRAAKAMCGLVYYPLYALFYPIRAWLKYTSRNRGGYLSERGITRWQYLLGKRVRPDE
ncbi:MAG: hypothetical protein LBJ84_05405 [Oscillospiraceae bacterium]|jgi:hypothetical protein|nr:hypothetical protein [Oscillospiraceae bacterium]